MKFTYKLTKVFQLRILYVTIERTVFCFHKFIRLYTDTSQIKITTQNSKIVKKCEILQSSSSCIYFLFSRTVQL